MIVCDFSGLDQAACDHCRSAGKPRRSTVTTRISSPIEARYPGVCWSCFEPYSAGAYITPTDTGWIAECCANGEGQP